MYAYFTLRTMGNKLQCQTSYRSLVKLSLLEKKQVTYFSSSPSDRSVSNLKLFKWVSGCIIFSSTVLIAWYAQVKKASKKRTTLHDFEYVSMPLDLFKSKAALYRYKGCVFLSQIAEAGVLKDLENFQFRHDDVIVSSFPKSGTTWLQEIVYMICNGCKRSHETLETRFPYLEYPYPGINTIMKMKRRRFIKSHLPYHLLPSSFHSSGAKLIYIVRNPKDTAISYYHFMKFLTQANFSGSYEDFVQLFLQDKVPYAPYSSHVKGYYNERNNPNLLFISYEDLHSDPKKVISQIANFLQICLTEADITEISKATNFESMQHNTSVNYEHWKDIGFAHKDGQFLRKGKIGDWRTYFTEDINSKFDDWIKSQNIPIDFIYEPPDD